MARNDDVLDGLYPAIVTSSKDPLDMGRVKVRFPWLHDEEESHWARVIRPYAGKQRGLFFLPEVGDEVMVVFELGDVHQPEVMGVFELGDVHQPMVLGGTWNGVDTPPEPGDSDGSNHHKVLETRSGHKLHFDDTPGAESVQLQDSSKNNIVRWDSASNSITITATTGDIHVLAPQGKITLKAKDVVMKASNNASRSVGGSETTSVGQGASETCGSGKTWSAQSTLTASAKQVTVGASGAMSVSGGNASVKCEGQETDVISVGGPTSDTVGELSVEADLVFEKAGQRTLNVGATKLLAPHVSFDASASVSLQAGSFSAKAKGQLSILGATVDVQAGAVLMKSGQINLNSKSEPPPGAAVPAPKKLVAP